MVTGVAIRVNRAYPGGPLEGNITSIPPMGQIKMSKDFGAEYGNKDGVATIANRAYTSVGRSINLVGLNRA